MKVGEVVISISGHDMGEWYIVKEVQEQFVYLIDGKNKPLLKPKKKKIKHIIKANYFANEIAQKLAQGAYIQDAEVRKTLKFFKNNI
ncbi:MAG: hypothetical protein IJW25_03220 [Clostridia bacterium]|nr:hypothetical protein [Clostridia bacterium]